jgi:L-ascorbate metabolism protein UlaG (beta-lactamase superfamily)
MKIKYFAHSSFLITADNGTRIITDPYHPAKDLNYNIVSESADIVTVSHGHMDHNFVESVDGDPKVLSKAGEQSVKGIHIKAIPTFHDTEKGSRRGPNLIFVFSCDGLNLCHMGDQGHLLSASQIAQIKPADVLLIPVGGYYTIDAGEAARISEDLGAKIIIPMHFKTAKCQLPIATVDDFISRKSTVNRLQGSEYEISADKLPTEPQIIVLSPANL